MEKKEEAIAKIILMMDNNKLDYILLDHAVMSKWPSDDRPYTIREIEYDREHDRLNVYQRWDQEQSFFQIEQFDSCVIADIAKEVERSIPLLKEYRVKVSTYADILATNPANAKKIIKYHPNEVKENNLQWLEVEGEPVEQTSWYIIRE